MEGGLEWGVFLDVVGIVVEGGGGDGGGEGVGGEGVREEGICG